MYAFLRQVINVDFPFFRKGKDFVCNKYDENTHEFSS